MRIYVNPNHVYNVEVLKVLKYCLFFGEMLTESRQGNEQTRSFEPTNERADYWPATHSYDFIIRVK